MSFENLNDEEFDKFFEEKLNDDPEFSKFYEFDLFLDDKMKREEREAFEQKLSENALLSIEFIEYKKFNNSLSHYFQETQYKNEIADSLEQEIKNDTEEFSRNTNSEFVKSRMQTLNSIMAEHRSNTNNSKNPASGKKVDFKPIPETIARKKYSLKIIYSVAASVLVIAASSIIFYFVNTKKNSNELFAENYSLYDFSGVKGTNNEIKNSLDIAFNSYRNKDFKTVLAITDTVSLKNELVYFMNAIAHMESGNYAKASESLTKITDNKQSQYIDDAYWYLGLCYLKTGEKEKAIQYFKQLQSTENIYFKKSKNILKNIE